MKRNEKNEIMKNIYEISYTILNKFEQIRASFK